jgi:hypothetical protein
MRATDRREGSNLEDTACTDSGKERNLGDIASGQ